MTRQKRLILSLLAAECRHMSAAEIYLRAKRELPHIALGTVYRNLGLLVDEGEIVRVSVPGKPDAYDTLKEKHDHMICALCGRIRDIFIPGLQDAIDYQTGEKTLSYELSISYICPDCRKKK